MDGRSVLKPVLFALTVAGVSACSRAGDCVPVLKDGWIRLPPTPDATTLAGYGRIENPCRTPAVVVAARSPAFMGAMLHETSVVDGVSRMREVEELPIDADSGVTLAPGGLHLMLMQPSAPVREGDKVAIDFKLKDGRKISGELAVRAATP
jgi:copper(I)-binding protein